MKPISSIDQTCILGLSLIEAARQNSSPAGIRGVPKGKYRLGHGYNHGLARVLTAYGVTASYGVLAVSVNV